MKRGRTKHKYTQMNLFLQENNNEDKHAVTLSIYT